MSTLSALSALEPRQAGDQEFPESLQPVACALAASQDSAQRMWAARVTRCPQAQLLLAADADPEVVGVLVCRNSGVHAQALLLAAARRTVACVRAAQHPVLDDAQCVTAVRAARCRVAAASPSLAAQFVSGPLRPDALELVASIVSYQALMSLARALLAHRSDPSFEVVLERLRRVVVRRLRGHNEPAVPWAPQPPKRPMHPRPPVYPPFGHVAHLLAAAWLLDVPSVYPSAAPAHGAQGSPVLEWWLEPSVLTDASDPVLRSLIHSAGAYASGVHASALEQSADCSAARAAVIGRHQAEASVLSAALERAQRTGQPVSAATLVDLALARQDDAVLRPVLLERLTSVSVPASRVPELLASSLRPYLLAQGGPTAAAMLAHPSATLDMALDAPYELACSSFHDRRALLEFMLVGLSPAQIETLLVLEEGKAMSARQLRAAVEVLG